MTNEERDIIGNFVARISGAAAAPSSPWGGASVPATTAPALPPVDREADQFIGEQFQRYPDARYRMTQLAFVQEHALIEAQNRIKRLEWELQQAQQAAQAQQAGQTAPQQSGGGFFSGLFGGGRSQSAPPPPRRGGPWGYGAPPPGYQPGYQGGPPPPQYPPGYNTGMFQRSGSGFLGSALTTAAGVAGGVLAADAISSMFSPHRGLGGGFGAEGMPAGGSPWAGPAADPGYVDQGAWTAPDPGAGGQPDQGYVDQGTWDQGGDQGGADQSGWNDPGSSDPSGGGWDQGGGDDPGFDSGGGGTDDSIL